MVEWKKLGELGPYFGGLTGKTKDDFVEGNAKFITYMNVFANTSLNINTTGVVRINEGERQNKIQKGDILFTGSSETPDEAGMSCVVTDELADDFYMNSFCFGIRLSHPEQYNLHFLKHVLRSNNVRREIAKSASGVTRFNISKARFGKVEIPIPSLSEQQRIVGILDTFTSAIDNLKEQIAQRRKQYEFYRDQLLDLEGKEGVEMKTLGEIVVFRNGKGHEKIINPDGKYIVVNSKFISSDGSVKKYCNEQISPLYVDDILMVMSDVPNGKAIAKCYLVERNNLYTLNQRIGAFHVCENNVITKYLYYVINRNKQLLQYDNKIDQTNLRKDDILNITIPLPSLSDQQRIVSILDTFEASIQNLEAQLKEREKQYEYYRNKLLTFE